MARHTAREGSTEVEPLGELGGRVEIDIAAILGTHYDVRVQPTVAAVATAKGCCM